MQGDQGAADISGEFQLLAGGREDLLDLGQRPVIAVFGQILIELLQRQLLTLRLDLLRLKQSDFALQDLELIIDTTGDQFGLTIGLLATLKPLRDLATQISYISAGIPPLQREQQSERANDDFESEARLLQQAGQGPFLGSRYSECLGFG